MQFCGQCGLQIPLGATRCPRCGASIEPESDRAVDALHADDPTVESISFTHAAPHPDGAGPHTPADQQPLVLHPADGGYSYGVPEADEPTSALQVPDYGAYQNAPVEPHPGTAGYADGGYYPITPTEYQGVSNYPAQPDNYAGFVPPGGEPYAPNRYQPARPAQRGKGRVVALLVVLVGLLIALGAMATYAFQHAQLLGNGGGSASSTTTSVSPTDQAKALVQQYYTDVNNKDYPSAYSLWNWGTNGPTLAKFERGYAHTVHDDLTINDATQLNDGTVRVSFTIVATENVGAGTRQRTYRGYYIVGQVDNTWKILRGYLGLI